MPIRFRCVYCDKLLGIATRKAGTVVNCPQCGQPLIVPTPEPERASQPKPATVGPRTAPTAPPTAVANVFEEEDFDVMLEPDGAGDSPPEPPPARRKTADKPPVPVPLPSRGFAAEQRMPAPAGNPAYAPLPLPALPASSGIVLFGTKLILAIVVLCILILVAFGAGLLVGRLF